MDWRGKKVLVTGGTSFIGSSLVDALVQRRASVRVVDNLSSGRLESIADHVASRTVEFVKGDLIDAAVAARAVASMSVVFHLAADHGGRGYVDLHNVECSTNLILDGQLFREAAKAKVERSSTPHRAAFTPITGRRTPRKNCT